MASNGNSIVKSLLTKDPAAEIRQWVPSSNPEGIPTSGGGINIQSAYQHAQTMRGKSFFLVHDRVPTFEGPGSGDENLSRGLSNLVQHLVWIRNNKEDRFEELRKQLALLVPNLGKLNVKIEARASIVVHNRGRDTLLSELGAGVAHLLALLIILSEPKHLGGYILIDEPETSLHPAGQRLLYQMIRDSGHQVIAATHSSIFLQETDPKDVYLFKAQSFHTFAVPDPGALAEFGLRASDLASASALLLVEGKSDIGVYSHLAKLLGTPIRQTTKIVPLETGNHAQAKIALKTVQELFERMPIPALCILDRDERSAYQLKQLQAHLDIHVLSRRELENYLVMPRALAKYLSTSDQVITIESIKSILDSLPNQLFYITLWKRLRETNPRLTQPLFLRENKPLVEQLAKTSPSVERDLAQEILPHLGVLDPATMADIGSEATSLAINLREDWLDPQKRLATFSGEEILKHVFSAFGRTYDKSRDAFGIALCLEKGEVAPELVDLLSRASGLK
jgi:hypothetical protein